MRAAMHWRSEDRRRLRRLFGALEDVASYTDGYTDTRLLELSWGRIAELVQAGLPGCGNCQEETCPVQAAVGRVADHAAGSPGWWQAIRLAARMSGARDTGPPDDSAGPAHR